MKAGGMMKCPYCEREMKKGSIYNGNQPVCWLPQGAAPSSLAFHAAADGVRLCDYESAAEKGRLRTLFKANGYKAEAGYCANCHLVIAPAAKE